MIEEALKILVKGESLSYNQTKEVMKEITEGMAAESQISAFLTGLRIKGETIDEITACAEVMKEKCIKTDLKGAETLDIVGTGGDMTNTFNISTTTAFVAAAGKVPIAKHGNRALTSKSGSIDVLEALGINVNTTLQKEYEIFKKLNICFMFAQNHHPAMKYASKVRKELKFRTIFNILGPLTNPASASSQLFGVYDRSLVHTLAQVISNLGVKNAIVVHGEDGMDEATITGETYISEARNGIIKDYTIKPEDFMLKRSTLEEIKGSSPKENAQIILDIFKGKERGAKRDIVILNSALAFYTYNKTRSIQEGIDLAKEIIDSKLCLDLLNKYIEITNEV